MIADGREMEAASRSGSLWVRVWSGSGCSSES